MNMWSLYVHFHFHFPVFYLIFSFVLSKTMCQPDVYYHGFDVL